MILSQIVPGATEARLEDTVFALPVSDPSIWRGVHSDDLRFALDDFASQGVDSRGRKNRSGQLRSDTLLEFDRLVREAEVPDCLHKDALKRQPPRILFIEFKDLYAVPFVLVAKYRGKCN